MAGTNSDSVRNSLEASSSRVGRVGDAQIREKASPCLSLLAGPGGTLSLAPECQLLTGRGALEGEGHSMGGAVRLPLWFLIVLGAAGFPPDFLSFLFSLYSGKFFSFSFARCIQLCLILLSISYLYYLVFVLFCLFL